MQIMGSRTTSSSLPAATTRADILAVAGPEVAQAAAPGDHRAYSDTLHASLSLHSSLSLDGTSAAQAAQIPLMPLLAPTMPPPGPRFDKKHRSKRRSHSAACYVSLPEKDAWTRNASFRPHRSRSLDMLLDSPSMPPQAQPRPAAARRSSAPYPRAARDSRELSSCLSDSRPATGRSRAGGSQRSTSRRMSGSRHSHVSDVGRPAEPDPMSIFEVGQLSAHIAVSGEARLHLHAVQSCAMPFL